MSSVGFVGTGDITAAMVAGICAAPAAPVQIFVGPRNAGKAADLAQAAQTPGGLNEQALRELANANWFGAIGSALDGILKRLEGGK
jgi:pyrroline-5-carboxylate reductase